MSKSTIEAADVVRINKMREKNGGARITDCWDNLFSCFQPIEKKQVVNWRFLGSQ